jgi:POT family proton-dependent oligopeptide transporter
MHEDGFWDAAKPSVYRSKNGATDESVRPKWMTWDDQWVDEVRRGFKACKVFLWYPVYCEWQSTLCVFV